jgi:dTDP-4-amino-4,6-dideoxygalactose transaminase
MDPIIKIANKHGLVVVEDAAQAIGSQYKGKSSGSIGHVGCFSTHPLKNLNACGDGGFLTTNDDHLYTKAKSQRNHGIVDRDKVDSFGYVSRMDNLQAAILNYRLKKLDEIIEKRRNNAKFYFKHIEAEEISLPLEKEYEFNTYHTFVIKVERRNELKEFLLKQGIETAIHYPIPIHLQPAAKRLKYILGDFPVTEKQAQRILTLPVNQSLSQVDLERIVAAIDDFYN